MEVEMKSSSAKILSSFKTIPDEEFGPYTYMFEFEREFDQWAVETWVAQNWAWLCLVVGLSYVLLVFLGIHVFFLKFSQETQFLRLLQARLLWILGKDSNCDSHLLSGVELLHCLVSWDDYH